MRFFLLFLLFLLLKADDSFITKYEYAKMLYKNPRGIGCYKCHGEHGEGKIIAKYKEKNKIKYIKAPDIRNISFKKFYKKLNSQKIKTVMPSYFLTRDEIEALYYYLKKVNKK